MLFYAAGLIFQISLLQSLGSGANVTGPENITVTFLNSSSVQISWSVDLKQIERYDIMYKPTEASYRVVAVVAANSNSVTLNNLLSNTQYQMSVTAIRDGKKYRSRPIVFRTLESGAVVTDLITNTDNETASGNVITLRTPDIIAGTGNTISPSAPVPPPPPYGPSNPQQAYIQVRGIEVTIVILVLMVWVGAIILFFNRWGKIRMLIPYQPDYKETQLKVPGTGACSSSNTCQNQNGSGLCCSQRTHQQSFKSTRFHSERSYLDDVPGKRTRFQSASCISREHQYMKLGGSGPVRKTKSADYIPTHYHKLENPKTRKKLPTVSISIASDSDNGNEDSS